MRLSSDTMERIERLSVIEDCPHDGDASSREGDEGLDVTVAFASLAIVEGFGGRVSGGDGAEGGLVEDTLEGFVAAIGAPERPGLSGLAQDGRKAGSGGHGVGGTKAGDVACRGNELSREHRPPFRAGCG